MPTRWKRDELGMLRVLSSPWRIQQFLDTLPYSTDPVYRSPRSVLRDRVAHCVDGGLFAAAALRRLGRRPLVTWTWSWNDDGHMLALFREGAWWGAIGKSNMVNLRYRPPVYRSQRELMMSYFNDYFNTIGQRTMRGYTPPLDLSRFDKLKWETSDRGVTPIVDGAIDRQRVHRVLTPRQEQRLEPVDERTLRAGFLGSRVEGLYVPEGTLGG